LDAMQFQINGFGQAQLTNFAMDPPLPGLDTSTLAQKRLAITVPDFADINGFEVAFENEIPTEQVDAWLAMGNVVAEVPDFDDLMAIKDLDFAAIIALVRQSITFLDQALSTSPVYESQLPVVNRSVKDTLSFLDDMAARVEEVANDPGILVHKVEEELEEALGINEDNWINGQGEGAKEYSAEFNQPVDWRDQQFSLYLDGSVLKLHLQWDALLHERLPFALDLDALGVDDIPGLSSLVDASGQVEFGIYAEVVLEMGMDFGDEGDFS